VATGALLMVGAVLGTAVIEESVVARPDAPGTDDGTAAPGPAELPQARSGPAATTSGPTRAVSFLVPLAPTSAGSTGGAEQPVASGASIGRGALGPSGAGLPAPAAGAVTAPAVSVSPAPATTPPVSGPQAQAPAGTTTRPPQSATQPPQGTTQPPQGTNPLPQGVFPQAQPPAVVTVKPPPVQTPAVGVPALTVPDLPVVGTVRTPSVDVSPAAVKAPTVSVSTSDGVAAGTGPAEVGTPDVGVGAVQAGPVGLSKTTVTVPDIALTKASVDLSPKGTDVALPGVSVSRTTVVTPDVELGPVDVPLPAVTLPAVAVPPVELPVDKPVKAVTGVVGSLLGGS